jgi:ribosomal protein L23
MKKEIAKRIEKICVVCGKKIKVILYKDRTYRGGHYFGKILSCGKDEYWECPRCYWKGWN